MKQSGFKKVLKEQINKAYEKNPNSHGLDLVIGFDENGNTEFDLQKPIELNDIIDRRPKKS